MENCPVEYDTMFKREKIEAIITSGNNALIEGRETGVNVIFCFPLPIRLDGQCIGYDRHQYGYMTHSHR
jgi:hypothetical protein